MPSKCYHSHSHTGCPKKGKKARGLEEEEGLSHETESDDNLRYSASHEAESGEESASSSDGPSSRDAAHTSEEETYRRKLAGNGAYPYPIKLPDQVCAPRRIKATLDVSCMLDARCNRDEITIYQSPPSTVEYEFGNMPLPVSGTLFNQMYPECPVTAAFTEQGESDYNVRGTYIQNFNVADCAFEVFTDDPSLEETVIPLLMSFEPLYGGLGDYVEFDLAIISSCGEPTLLPVVFDSDRFQVNLWDDLQIPFSPYVADENCGDTTFSMLTSFSNRRNLDNTAGSIFDADFEENLVFGVAVDRVTAPGIYNFSIQTNYLMKNGGERTV